MYCLYFCFSDHLSQFIRIIWQLDYYKLLLYIMIQDLNLCRSSVFTLLIASFLQVWIHYCFKHIFKIYNYAVFTLKLNNKHSWTREKHTTKILLHVFLLNIDFCSSVSNSNLPITSRCRHGFPHLPLAIQKQVDLIASNGIPETADNIRKSSQHHHAVTKMAIGFKPGGFFKGE